MITWMQRHKKWLIITIWISTIAFIGAGFVGWGAYKYGDRASLVAKVGDIDITVAEFQKAYSDLYNQYAQMLQGNFDKEKAKAFGLDKQALLRLIDQALILNLAKEYDVFVSDKELAEAIANLPYFQKNGKFDKNLYKQVLLQNNLKLKEFEEGMRKDLILQKVLNLLPTVASVNENKIGDTIFNIADKIKYKLLTTKDIDITIDKKKLKAFWEQTKDRFKTDVIYHIALIEQQPLTKRFDEKTLKKRYNDNKTHFRADDGTILPFEQAKEKVAAELNAKETKKAALKSYIAFKKGVLPTQKELDVSASNNPYGSELLKKLAKASPGSFLKPIPYGNGYIVVKLLLVKPAKTKTFEAARSELLPLYIAEQKKRKLLEIAKKSVRSFKGTLSDFVTFNDAKKLTALDEKSAKKFLSQLFTQHNKQGFIVIDDKNIVLFDILEQKLLKDTHNESAAIVRKIKQTLFDQNIVKKLREMYDIEIYYKGL